MASNEINFTRIKRRLTFSTPVAALEDDDSDSTPRRPESIRPSKNARLCSSPFSFAVPSRQSASFLRTPTMKSMAPAQHARTIARRGRSNRVIATPTSACVLKWAPSQETNRTSQAASAEAMPQPQMSPDSATRAVYANLFGCPAQFASIAEVLPDSQGPAGDDNVTPLTGVSDGHTPATMFAASAHTEKSEGGNSRTGRDINTVEEGDVHVQQSGVIDMAGFGSPAVAAQDDGLIAAVPSSAPFRTFLQAVVSQAQAGHGDNAVIHSPWAPTLLHSKEVDNPFLWQHQPSVASHLAEHADIMPSHTATANGSDFRFHTQICLRDNLVSTQEILRQGSRRVLLQESGCSLRHSNGPFTMASADSLPGTSSLSSADMALTHVGSLQPSFTHASIGDISGDASDSDMEDSDDQPTGIISDSEDDEDNFMQQQTSSLQFELLAADLDDRFEALSMLSPDNQVPLLSRSLGRRVSVHGAHGDVLEPWGRAAVFGCNTTSSGRLSIAASLAGSTHSHGPGTAMLKLARSEARHGAKAATVWDVLDDVKTPLTSGKRKDEVLSTIGAPLEVPTRNKCIRTPTASPVPFSMRLGACMLEPARRSTPGTMECPSGQNTEASSPDTAGRTGSRVSTVTLSLTSLFEEIHANQHELCDI
eukprot:jgi/Ulvmu1/12035/UM083_0048.1